MRPDRKTDSAKPARPKKIDRIGKQGSDANSARGRIDFAVGERDSARLLIHMAVSKYQLQGNALSLLFDCSLGGIPAMKIRELLFAYGEVRLNGVHLRYGSQNRVWTD